MHSTIDGEIEGDFTKNIILHNTNITKETYEKKTAFTCIGHYSNSKQRNRYDTRNIFLK